MVGIHDLLRGTPLRSCAAWCRRQKGDKCGNPTVEADYEQCFLGQVYVKHFKTHATAHLIHSCCLNMHALKHSDDGEGLHVE